jgi:hypothetical protein
MENKAISGQLDALLFIDLDLNEDKQNFWIFSQSDSKNKCKQRLRPHVRKFKK